MATQQDTVLLSIKIDPGESQKQLTDYKTAMDLLKKDIKELEKQNKELMKDFDTNASAIEKNNNKIVLLQQNLRKLKTEEKEVSKAVQDSMKSQKKATESFDEMRRALEQLGTEYQKLSSKDRNLNLGDLEKKLGSYKTYIELVRKEIAGLEQENKKLGENFSQNAGSIEKNNQRIVTLKESLKRLTSEEKDLQKAAAMMNQGNVNAGKTLEELRKTLTALNAEYKKLTQEHKNNPYGKALQAQIRAVTEEVKKQESSLGQFARNVGNYANSFGKVAMNMTKWVIGAQGLFTVFQRLKQAITDGISTAMEYGRETSRLAAILQTTKESTAALNAQARELGATTAYTATQVTQLQIELAKLGYQKEQILAMTKGVLQFAKATGSELAEAAALTGAALRMYGDSALQTTNYVDKMAVATTHSALSFHYLQTALPIVGSVANAFNFSLEDTLALLGQLANAGFDASMAATATRNILLNLANANGELAKQLGKPVTNIDELVAGLKKLQDQGINLNESLQLTDKRSVAAFNAFLKTADGVTTLRKAMEGASKEAQALSTTTKQTLQNLINDTGELAEKIGVPIETVGDLKRALKFLEEQNYDYRKELGLTDNASRQAFETFLNGVDSAMKLQDALTGCTGAAERMAKEMADNLAGDVVTLKSAWDEFNIALNQSQGLFRNIVQWATEVVRWFDTLVVDVETIAQRINNSAVTKMTDPRGKTMQYNIAADDRWVKNRIEQYKKKGLEDAEAEAKAYGDIQIALQKKIEDKQKELDKIRRERDKKTTGKKGSEEWFAGELATLSNERLEQMAKTGSAATSLFESAYQVSSVNEKRRKEIAKDLLRIRKEEARLTGEIALDQARITEQQSKLQDLRSKNDGMGLVTDKERRKQEAEAKRFANNQKRAEDAELKARQNFEKAMYDLIGKSIEARRKLVENEYTDRIEKLLLANKHLKEDLERNDHLNAEAQTSIRNTIEYNSKQIVAIRRKMNEELEKLSQDQYRQEIERERKRLDAELKLVEFDLKKLRKLQEEKEDVNWKATRAELSDTRTNGIRANLDMREQEELKSVQAGSAEALAIQKKYADLWKLAEEQKWDEFLEMNAKIAKNQTGLLATMNTEALDLVRQGNLLIEAEDTRHFEALDKIGDNYNQNVIQKQREQMQLQISIMREQYSEMLAAQTDIVTANVDLVKQAEMDILAKEFEAAEKERMLIEERGKLSTQTIQEYEQEKTDAKQREVDARIRLNEAEIKNQQAVVTAMGDLTDSIIGLLKQLGENDQEAAEMAKVLAIGKIAIESGVAIAQGIKAASGVSFPGNLAAIATTIGTIMKNITTALSMVKSAKFAQGGKVEGPGTGTSDSIQANLSNGEFVMTAKATKLFEPLLTVMNQIGAGAPMQTNGMYDRVKESDDLAESFKAAAQEIRPVVSVQDINTGQRRVEVIQNLDNY